MNKTNLKLSTTPSHLSPVANMKGSSLLCLPVSFAFALEAREDLGATVIGASGISSFVSVSAFDSPSSAGSFPSAASLAAVSASFLAENSLLLLCLLVSPK